MVLYGCEKNINIRLKASEPELVVEATIENGQPPVVILSQSINYFSRITPAILENSFIHDASVFVSDGSLTHHLKEYKISLGSGYNVYYYSIDSSNLATAFTGRLHSAYSLRINWKGNDYTATTTIPKITKKIDSLFWEPAPGNNKPGKVALMIRATDPPGLGDYIRYFTKRNSEPFYPGLTSVFDDQIVDGTTYTVRIDRGVDRNASRSDDYMYFDKGDTITLKLCNIDKATFDFWRTMEFNYATAGNPFSSPTQVVNNIRGNALGYFGGYAAQYHTIIVPR
jgi:putative component of toxin-antitoxin plasmid stabilization module